MKPPNKISRLGLSLLLHVVAALVLFTVTSKVTPEVPSSPRQQVTFLSPRVKLPRPPPRLPATIPAPSVKTPLPVRAFRPVLPVAPVAALAPRVLELTPLPVQLAVVPPPVLRISPDPLPPNLPPRPLAPVKLGNLTEASATQAAARAPVTATGAFGAAQVSERTGDAAAVRASGFGAVDLTRIERDNPRTISSGGFGDARIVKPYAVDASPQTIAAMTPIEILSKPRPEYTDEARKLRLEGEVVLEMRFGANGQAEILHVTRGLGHGLDESARRAALTIRFRPAQKAGMPIDSTAIVHIIFQLAY